MKYIELLKKIQEKNGTKIVTIMVENDTEVFNITDSIENEVNILKWFKRGMETHGSLVIRQVLGKEEFCIAGILLGNKHYYSVEREHIAWAYSFDAETGEPLPVELGVTFVQFENM